jgi:hypothetical protein
MDDCRVRRCWCGRFSATCRHFDSPSPSLSQNSQDSSQNGPVRQRSPTGIWLHNFARLAFAQLRYFFPQNYSRWVKSWQRATFVFSFGFVPMTRMSTRSRVLRHSTSRAHYQAPSIVRMAAFQHRLTAIQAPWPAKFHHPLGERCRWTDCMAFNGLWILEDTLVHVPSARALRRTWPPQYPTEKRDRASTRTQPLTARHALLKRHDSGVYILQYPPIILPTPTTATSSPARYNIMSDPSIILQELPELVRSHSFSYMRITLISQFRLGIPVPSRKFDDVATVSQLGRSCLRRRPLEGSSGYIQHMGIKRESWIRSKGGE